MPWSSKDAKRHTKKASSPVKERQWAHVSNSMLDRGYDDASAIKAANSVIKKGKSKDKGKGGLRKK